jgi:hypothetical protein
MQKSVSALLVKYAGLCIHEWVSTNEKHTYTHTTYVAGIKCNVQFANNCCTLHYWPHDRTLCVCVCASAKHHQRHQPTTPCTADKLSEAEKTGCSKLRATADGSSESYSLMLLVQFLHIYKLLHAHGHGSWRGLRTDTREYRSSPPQQHTFINYTTARRDYSINYPQRTALSSSADYSPSSLL